jgi:hypothetical protein
MAGKININPDTVKGNIDLIIVVVATLGLLGYGWLQLDATGTTRAASSEKLESQTRTYNEKKNYSLPESLGLTNSPSITTDESHGNLGLVKEAGTNFVSHLNRVRAKFAPLVIPDGLVLDEKTGAIISVTLMQRGTKYSATAPPVFVKSVNGKGAKLKSHTRSMGGDTPDQYYVERIEVIDGGTGYTKGDIAIIIGDDLGGGGGADPNGFDPVQGGAPGFDAPPGQVGMPNQMGMMGMPGMPGMGMMGSGGVSEDDSEARYGLDNDTFRDFMQSTVFGLQSRCKAQRIRLPQIDDESKDFRFSFSKVWNKYEFEPLEREVMSFQLAEIEVLCEALFTANIHEIYNLKRLKVVRKTEDLGMDMEDALEYLQENEFSLNDVMKFATGSNPDGTQREGLVAGARVMPYEVTFRGFSAELSKVLEELYKSQVFFVVKNIAVIAATDVVDVFEEEQSEMTLGAFGPGGRGGREMYGMGGRGGMMDPRYQAMLGGQGFGGVGGENKRRRPASLLLDESPLKITLRINSLKVVAKEKDDSDAISALANKIEEAKVEEDKGDDDVFVEDTDGDGVDDYDESLLGPDGDPIGDKDDPDVTPTEEQIEAGTPP